MLSLVVPVYNNALSLPALLDQVAALAPRISGGLEVVFVVDGSPDDSLRILKDRLPSWQVPSQLVELSRNFGSFAAIAAGLQQGRGEYFAVIAADLQEPPELVVTFHAMLAAGTADVVMGHRTKRADPWLSQILSNVFWRMYRRFVMPDLPPGGIDVFGCTREVRDRLLELKEIHTNLIAQLLWLGYRRAFVPYERRARVGGRSAWTMAKKLRYALDSIFSFTDLPLRVLLLLGATATTAAIVAAVTVLICWWLGLITVLGYTPLMLAITSFGGLTALGLGIVGEYLWLSLQNTRNRPPFIVRAVDRFEK
jgi:glycosyltransferase involved in cell wall biosynthesis